MSASIDLSARDLVLRLSISNISPLSKAESENERGDKERIIRTATSESIYYVEYPTSFESAQPFEPLSDLNVGRIGTQSEQPQVNIWDRRWFGLIIHSVAYGIVSIALPQSVYPFLTCNLNMEGSQTLSARILLNMPWALKPVFSLFVHCFPFPSGFRFRATMLIGWIISSAALIAIYFQDQPAPYFRDRKMVGIPLDQMSTQQMSKINLDAPSHGSFYVMMMSVASLGYVLADVAADDLIQDAAKRYFGASESPRSSDEAFQATMTKYRVIATLVCFVFMGFGMCGSDYGGEFDFTLEYTEVMLLVGLVSLAPVILIGFTTSEPACERRSLCQSLSEILALMKNCGLNYVLLCQLLGGMLAGASATPVNPIAFYYAGVGPLNDSVMSFVAILVGLMALKWVDKKGWNVNYRSVIVIGTIVLLVLDFGTTMLTIWDVVRSQWFWIGVPVMDAIPSAIDFTITTTVLAEVADPKTYAMISGLVTSVSSLAGPIGIAMSELIDAQFDVTNQDIMNDTTDVRSQIMLTFLIAYVMRLGSLLWLFALPHQAKKEANLPSEVSTVRGMVFLFTFNHRGRSTSHEGEGKILSEDPGEQVDEIMALRGGNLAYEEGYIVEEAKPSSWQHDKHETERTAPALESGDTHPKHEVT
ncbi:hypothetical protein PsorP6_005774 [Peronosclerospora sorghi]|uniref:Uncharacterized protein n=1 Tax=Peronosclerospora sorghi TaxID=230839 RepID=A0ACC0W7P7_9STRA|nr:hypothetical protein PsorP6_005774 [Peronosclerospora sorghi]